MAYTYIGIYIGMIAILLTLVLVPHQTRALSCLDPAGMIEHYLDNDDYVIFTAIAGETKEFVKEEADPAGIDPNMQFNSGYTGQYVEALEAYKGYPHDKQWVYFQTDSTWGYLCAGAPAEEGAEILYVISESGGLFSLPQVVNSYPADSQMALDIIEALAAGAADNEPTVQETSVVDWQNRLRSDINEMLFLAKVKLAELRFWLAF